MSNLELHRLIYRSAFGPAFPRVEGDELNEIHSILTSSLRNNETLNITGLLAVYQNSFVQVLEGPLAGVSTIFDRIVVDPRNEKVTLLGTREVENRKFPDWSMCACRLSRADNIILGSLNLSTSFSVGSLDFDSAFTFLRSVRSLKAQAENIFLIA